MFLSFSVHQGFMFHLMLLNECILHYFSVMCVNILAFTSACGKAICIEPHVSFALPHVFYPGYQCIIKAIHKCD